MIKSQNLSFTILKSYKNVKNIEATLKYRYTATLLLITLLQTDCANTDWYK